MMPIKIRTANRADAGNLIAMHALSLRRLARAFYDPEVLEAFITQGPLDLTLLDGQGYFVAESNGVLLGSGGWSPEVPHYHGTLKRMDAEPSGPVATVRSVFVHPNAARRGVASVLMTRIEAEIRAHGFQTAALHATLSGIPFYRKSGWRGGLPVVVGLPGGHAMVGLSMTKELRSEFGVAA
mgnify:CR=1 FL=1